MNKRLIPVCILIAYCVILVKLLVFKDLPVIRIGALMLNFGGTHEGPANLVPFKTIFPYLRGDKGFIIAAINLIGNIVLLIPVGLLVPFVFKKVTSKKCLVLAVATGLSIEGMQALLRVGIFDIDDVLLNGLGVMLGYSAFTLFRKMKRPVKFKYLRITLITVMLAGAAAAWYGIDVYQKDQQPVNYRQDIVNNLPDSIHEDSVRHLQNLDPCNGTGGTGQIVSVRNNGITIKRHDNTTIIINFTTRTTVRNAAGLVSKTDLHSGDSVALVVDFNSDGTGTATTVIVCNAGSRQE